MLTCYYWDMQPHGSTSTSCQQRHLVLVDIENFVGGPRATAGEAARARRELDDLIAISSGKQVIVSCSHFAASELAFGWGDLGRRVWRSGVDGADLALLDVLEQEPILDRFTNLTIVSGDGIFAPAIAELSRKGVHTTVVARIGSLSHQSRLAADTVIEVLLGDDHAWAA